MKSYIHEVKIHLIARQEVNYILDFFEKSTLSNYVKTWLEQERN